MSGTKDNICNILEVVRITHQKFVLALIGRVFECYVLTSINPNFLIGCSFTGVMSSDAPTSIGNYEPPNDAYIPSNFTIPSGNVYKFKLYSGGYVWYKCNITSGKWNIGGKVIIRSAIPKHDTSTMTVAVIGTAPSANPKKDYSYELISVTDSTGKGAFEDVSYLILSEAEGGVAPPDKECGTKYPDGYIYSTDITATVLYFHPGTK
ncbi:12652_t:CDS:2 [Gigaspora rosea]|nr:12652_t:CDS:2 [Gigaspora rosea]